MKTGIYGGTFNPVHSGHIHILREFIRRLGLERALLIPTGTPPHKNAPLLAAPEHRLAMCALAAKEVTEAPVEVSKIELSRPGKSYTAQTLEALQKQYPADDFYLLMGEDMFLTLDKWYRPETICALAALCASPRSENGLEKLLRQKEKLERAFGARCFVEDIPWLPVSSTQVRELAAAGKSLSGLAPVSVEQYLREHGVYSQKEGEGRP